MNKNKKYKIDKYSLRSKEVLDFNTELIIELSELCKNFTKLARLGLSNDSPISGFVVGIVAESEIRTIKLTIPININTIRYNGVGK
jgi:hypothetical protein